MRSLLAHLDAALALPQLPMSPLPGTGPLATLASGLAASALPREGLLELRHLLEAAGEEPFQGALAELSARGRGALAALLTAGPELPRILRREPLRRLELLGDPLLRRRHGPAELLAAFERLLPSGGWRDADAVAAAIARFRNDQLLRLAACEFGAAGERQSELGWIGGQLADVADVCVEVALATATSAAEARFGAPLGEDGGRCGLAVIAMGKYGAQELNFCSDIDLLFIYGSDEGRVGDASVSLHQFFSHICRDVVRLLSEPLAEGRAYHVDLRLRPEGQRGAICNSLAGAEHYYEAWGSTTDRLAWLKARPCAGDRRLGQQMVELLRPFVFPSAFGPEVIEALAELTQKIRRELERSSGSSRGYNVKLGPGGLRDIEFFVQALQLLHAGKHPGLRERSTLRALDKLLLAGLLSDEERRHLADGYVLLRRLEHRLQLHGGRQTHLLPHEGALRAQIAAHLGYTDEALEAELGERRRRVEAIYSTVGPHGAEVPPRSAVKLADLTAALARPVDRDDEESAEGRRALLAAVGFGDPLWADQVLAELRALPWGPFGHAADAALRALAESILVDTSRSPEPDAALRHFCELCRRYGRHRGLWRLLADHEPLRRLLLNLFGSSDLMAEILLAHPELLDGLLLSGGFARATAPAERWERLDARLARCGDDLEARFAALERFRDEELLRVGLRDIGGDVAPEAVWAELSQLAEGLLQRVHGLVHGAAVRRYGEPRDAAGELASMTILGLGKLGSGEMSYGSDLDLIFVYSAEGRTDGARPISNSEFFVRVAQRLIRALTAGFVFRPLYRVDTRLRPSGSQGTLVVSEQAFKAHHELGARIWEQLALLRARAVAGDRHLGGQVERWISAFLRRKAPCRDTLRREVVALRRRVEKELADEKGPFYNLKLGKGGLLDIEFIAQYYSLGCDLGPIRTTPGALRRAVRGGHLEGHLGARLEAAHGFLRGLEGRLRIVRGRSDERLPRDPDALDVVARRMGYRQRAEVSVGAQLLDDYRAHTAEVRGLFGRLLGEGAEVAT